MCCTCCTVHCTPTSHSTLPVCAHISQNTMHQHRTVCCALHICMAGTTRHCTLHTAHCTLHIAQCTLHIAWCTLHTAHRHITVPCTLKQPHHDSQGKGPSAPVPQHPCDDGAGDPSTFARNSKVWLDHPSRTPWASGTKASPRTAFHHTNASACAFLMTMPHQQKACASASVAPC